MATAATSATLLMNVLTNNESVTKWELRFWQPSATAAQRLPFTTFSHEQMVAQWTRALPEVCVGADGSLALDERAELLPPQPVFDADAHGGGGVVAWAERAPGSRHWEIAVATFDGEVTNVRVVGQGMSSVEV